MTNQPKIVFFGTENFSLASLKALVENNFQIAAVVTKPDQPKGRGHKLTAPAVKTYALENNIPVWQPDKLNQIKQQISDLGPVTGVLVSYGKIIPQAIIDLFTPGIINLHPSLLPRYRGPTPIESAIHNGDKTSGVSIMSLSAAMDAGPVYRQFTHRLSGSETQPELYDALSQIGADKLVEFLPGIINGKVHANSQNDSKASYCRLLYKTDALLSPDELDADEAERKVRAHLTYPKTKYQIDDKIITITKAHVSQEAKNPLDIACQTGFLSVDELNAPSGRTMSAQAFLRGYVDND